jgi:hypothetical protein
MSISFASPSMRAAGSDLAMQISPLGLVELSVEEFEVHGPRLNRYAQNWAFYLGHHWAYRREAGEAQLTFNYVKALSDYITNFSFGRGAQFKSPEATSHIVPALLKRVWEEDNDKEVLLWQMGQEGGVSGDCFVKVAWEPPYEDSVGSQHPGKVRILPLKAAHVFPEWHPHDPNRLLRLKLKYKFWGTSQEGTRQVYTYTEILTDEWIEEYINDDLLDQRQNPLGVIPVVHIPNIKISGSPWGAADIADITMLNREYNEKATDISDIINYHASPVTVITGAKASNLEKGAKKVWAIPAKDVKVFNLEGGTGAIPAALEYLDRLKRAMHEITGVPETALGQIQPISNTSGVALSIMYEPMMQRYAMKKLTYTVGFVQINYIVLRTLFTFMPEDLVFNPDTDGIMTDEGQPPVLNPGDPVTFKSTVHWPPPLPIDALIKLQELQLKMGMGLESKRGALRELGAEFPDEKMQEIFEELLQDAKDQGALDLVTATIQASIMALTGMVPGPDGNSQVAEPPSDNETETGDGPPAPPPVDFSAMSAGELNQSMAELVTKAYGTKLPSRKASPDS